MKELSGKQPIETHSMQRCDGPKGIVPEGKEPGRDVTAKVFPDISREITCDNFNPNKKCDIVPQENCVFTRTPHNQLIPHALSHIESKSDASRTSLQDVLGRNSIQVSRLTEHLIKDGAVAEEGSIPTTGRPQRRLIVTGEPSSPYTTGKQIRKE